MGLRSVFLLTGCPCALLPRFSPSPAKPCRTKVPRARAGRPPERETPRTSRSGPVSVGCSQVRAPRFPTTLPGKVDAEPPTSENAKLEAEAARVHQEGSRLPPGREGQQEGSSPHEERPREGSSPHQGQEGSSPHQGQGQAGSV